MGTNQQQPQRGNAIPAPMGCAKMAVGLSESPKYSIVSSHQAFFAVFSLRKTAEGQHALSLKSVFYLCFFCSLPFSLAFHSFCIADKDQSLYKFYAPSFPVLFPPAM